MQTAAYWFAAATWAFGPMPQPPPKLRNSWRNATVPGSLENDTVARKMGLAPAESRQILAPRLDGGVGHYRVYADVEPPLLVDSDRAYNAHNLLGAYGKSYFWAYRLFWLLMATTFFGGFLSLIWWPWWTPIGGLFLTRVIYGSSKECCADFVRDVVAVNPESRERFAVVGLIRADVPPSAIPA